MKNGKDEMRISHIFIKV